MAPESNHRGELFNFKPTDRTGFAPVAASASRGCWRRCCLWRRCLFRWSGRDCIGIRLHRRKTGSWPSFRQRLKNFKQLERVSDLFLAYYRDHFGLRNTMIRSLSIAKFHGGLAYDRSTNIIIGKDGWLFYPSDPHDLLADRNLEPFTSGELDVWQTMLERRFKFCTDHGIKFIADNPAG